MIRASAARRRHLKLHADDVRTVHAGACRPLTVEKGSNSFGLESTAWYRGDQAVGINLDRDPRNDTIDAGGAACAFRLGLEDHLVLRAGGADRQQPAVLADGAITLSNQGVAAFGAQPGVAITFGGEAARRAKSGDAP